MTRLKVKELIKDIEKLEPIPRVTHHLLDVLDDKNSTAEAIAEIIQYEPTVTANVIRTCNSSFFGRKQPVNSIKEAVTTLGLDKVVEIVLYQSGHRVFSKADKGYEENEGALWKSSVSSAVMTKQIAIKTGSRNKNFLFTASLIKDIGKTIIGRFVQGSIKKITDLVDNKNYSFVEAEKKVIGINHAELGGMIAKHWNFTDMMQVLIKNHHAPNQKHIKNKDLATIYLADRMCMMMGLTGWIDRNDREFYDDAMQVLNLSQEDLPEVIAEFSMEMQEVEELMRVV